MSEKLTKIFDAIQTFRASGEDTHRLLNIMLDMVCELERIEAAAQKGAATQESELKQHERRKAEAMASN